MPKILSEEEKIARALRTQAADVARALRAETAEHVDFHAGSKDIVAAIKKHGAALVAKVKEMAA